MDQKTNKILFALLRTVICGTQLTEGERKDYSPEMVLDLLKIATKHDVGHIFLLGLKQNKLANRENIDVERYIFKKMYRYERIKYEYETLCSALENAHIPFLPLKGSVIRKLYPEEWIRTSCDIDVLVHLEDLNETISYLSENLGYIEKERSTHDVSMLSPLGVYVEIHFDLVEEGRAHNAINILSSVWENVTLRENCEYLYEMNDTFFYFYHIAHMAKHFETGGCGIRPFLDLWLLDHINGIDQFARDALLSQGGLLKFAVASRTLSRVWFDGKEPDELSIQMQDFILHGGAYGSSGNRVLLQQKKRGGPVGYAFSRIFIPYEKLSRYYPILKKHRWLMPFMQVRRWFMLLKPDVARMAKREMVVNRTLDKSKADEMSAFLDNIGLK